MIKRKSNRYVFNNKCISQESNQRPSRGKADFYPVNWDDITQSPNICTIYQCNSGHFTTSENEWNRRNTTKLVFPSLCPLKSRGEDFKNGFQIIHFSWILLVPKHSLLKYFTLTFTRHRSSKFEGSGPPLILYDLLYENLNFLWKS